VNNTLIEVNLWFLVTVIALWYWDSRVEMFRMFCQRFTTLFSNKGIWTNLFKTYKYDDWCVISSLSNLIISVCEFKAC